MDAPHGKPLLWPSCLSYHARQACPMWFGVLLVLMLRLVCFSPPVWVDGEGDTAAIYLSINWVAICCVLDAAGWHHTAVGRSVVLGACIKLVSALASNQDRCKYPHLFVLTRIACLDLGLRDGMSSQTSLNNYYDCESPLAQHLTSITS